MEKGASSDAIITRRRVPYTEERVIIVWSDILEAYLEREKEKYPVFVYRDFCASSQTLEDVLSSLGVKHGVYILEPSLKRIDGKTDVIFQLEREDGKAFRDTLFKNKITAIKPWERNHGIKTQLYAKEFMDAHPLR